MKIEAKIKWYSSLCLVQYVTKIFFLLMIFVCSYMYVMLLHHSSGSGDYAIQWLSSVVVYHICFSIIIVYFLTEFRSLLLLIWIVFPFWGNIHKLTLRYWFPIVGAYISVILFNFWRRVVLLAIKSHIFNYLYCSIVFKSMNNTNGYSRVSIILLIFYFIGFLLVSMRHK